MVEKPWFHWADSPVLKATSASCGIMAAAEVWEALFQNVCWDQPFTRLTAFYNLLQEKKNESTILGKASYHEYALPLETPCLTNFQGILEHPIKKTQPEITTLHAYYSQLFMMSQFGNDLGHIYMWVINCPGVIYFNVSLLLVMQRRKWKWGICHANEHSSQSRL